MSHAEAAEALLSGSFDHPRSLHGLFAGIKDPGKVLTTASALLADTEKTDRVIRALEGRGIHPLSLLLFDEKDIGERPWLREAVPSFADPFDCCLSRRQNLVMIRGYSPRDSASRCGRLILDPMIQAIHLADAFPGGLFGLDSHLKADLTIIACEGMITLPCRVDGSLKITFSPARLVFPPEKLRLRGRLEIRDVPLPFSLPRTLHAWELILDRCPGLRRLPSTLPGLRVLDVIQTPIRSLPHHLPNLEHLHLSGIEGLRRIRLQASRKIRVRLDDLPLLETIELGRPSVIEQLVVSRCPRFSGIA